MTGADMVPPQTEVSDQTASQPKPAGAATTPVLHQSRRENLVLPEGEAPAEATQTTASDKADKPHFLLVLAGLAGAAAIITLIYIIYSL